MEAAIPTEPSSNIADIVITSALGRVEGWIDLCDRFRKWERETVILTTPAPEIIAKHKKALAMMLKSTRLMLTLACDPESFDSEIFSKLSILHEQLQHSWKMLYETLPAEEIARNEALLAEIFPE